MPSERAWKQYLAMTNRFSTCISSDSKIIKFLSTGFLNTVFGYLVYALLIFVDVPYLTALLVATVAGVVFNYFSFGRMVFDRCGGWLVFGKFVIAYAAIYFSNAALLSKLTNDIINNPYLAQALCIPPSVILSWVLMNFWVYKND